MKQSNISVPGISWNSDWDKKIIVGKAPIHAFFVFIFGIFKILLFTMKEAVSSFAVNELLMLNFSDVALER